eukprot:GHVL01030881.1.p1 GENE.GHVL01030881.1~~GHVL01030881.1.p1  ORF type:complete len:198 (+),score=19.19 GHVL01030881.1:77-670(+)
MSDSSSQDLLITDNLKNEKKQIYGTSDESDIPIYDNFGMGKGFIYSIRLSRIYLIFCIFCTILSFVLLAISAINGYTHSSPRNPWYLTGDVLLTSFVTAETISDLIILRLSFWKSGWHILDFTCMILSIGCLVFDVAFPATAVGSYDDVVQFSLTAIRYVTQLARIVMLVHTSFTRESEQMADLPINFQNNDPMFID